MPGQRTADFQPQWYASLDMAFTRKAEKTLLSHCRREGPLTLQRAFYPEQDGSAHLYLLHPPAGIVSGDELRIAAVLGQDSGVLFTTPGANRFYRARQDRLKDNRQLQRMQVEIGAGASFENLPMETLVYDGANAVNLVDVYLAENSYFLGWDIFCLGLPASKQRFQSGFFRQRYRLYFKNKLLLHERLNLSADNALMTSPAGLGQADVAGTFFIFAAGLTEQTADRRALLEQMRNRIIAIKAGKFIAITDVRGIFIARYLGRHAEQCRYFFTELWQEVRPVILGKKAVVPRIWFT